MFGICGRRDKAGYLRFSGSGCPCRRGEALPGKREKAYCAGRVLFHRSAAAAMAGESALRGVCHFHRYARAVMAGEKRRRDACPARGNWLLESGRGRITSSAPFLQARRRCHGGRKRVARSLSFSQVCALSWRGKSAEGMPFRRREAASGKTGEGVLRRARPFSQACALPWRGKAPSGYLSSAWKPFRRSGRRRVAPGMSFFTAISPLPWRGKAPNGCLSDTGKREKVCCAECALFAGAPPLS